MKKILKKIVRGVKNIFKSTPPVEERSVSEKVEEIIKREDALEK